MQTLSIKGAEPYLSGAESFEQIDRLYAALNADESHFATSNDICTPLGCVKEMVDTIPPSFWRRKNLKILDSCSGNGNFHAYIRTKTALANLYFNEINATRVANTKRIFGHAINIQNRDFLSFGDLLSAREKDEYDLVVSNPPYAKFTGGARTAKNHNLARDFIKKALFVTKPGGYLLFIVPNNWMSLSDRNTLPRLLSRYQFIHLDLGTAKKKWFPKVGSSFTWFLLRKVANEKPCTVVNDYILRDRRQVKIEPGMDFLPLYYSEEVRRIFNKTVNAPNRKYAVETSSDLHRTTKSHLLSESQTPNFPYKIMHTPTQVLWSKRAHKFQNSWKVFISLTNQFGTFVDRCGSTQSIAFIRCRTKTEALQVSEALRGEVYLFLNNLTRYGNFNNVRVLQRLPLPGEFKLSAAEERLIKKINGLYYRRPVTVHAYFPKLMKYDIFGKRGEEPFPSPKTVEKEILRRFIKRHGQVPIGCTQK